MSSSYDSYRSSSTASSSLRSPRYQSTSNYLDLSPTTGGSERAEFHDRYQNRVNIPKKNIFSKFISRLFSSMHGLKKIMSMKLVPNTKH